MFEDGYVEFSIMVNSLPMVEDILNSCKDESGELFNVCASSMNGTYPYNVFFESTILKIDVNKLKEKLESLNLYNTNERDKSQFIEYYNSPNYTGEV
jgi:hypothetical protein